VGDGVDRRVLEQLLDVHDMLLAGVAALAVERLSEPALARARALVAELVVPGRTAVEFHARVEALVELATEATGHLVLRLFRNAFDPAVLEGVRVLGPYFRVDSGLGDVGRALDAALAARDSEAAPAAVRVLSRAVRARIASALDAYEADRGRGAAERASA
jgi:DNA-binding FadR family transcriptional regulator